MNMKLPVVSGKDIIKALSKIGYYKGGRFNSRRIFGVFITQVERFSRKSRENNDVIILMTIPGIDYYSAMIISRAGITKET